MTGHSSTEGQLERLAREITIMFECGGGPLSRPDWVRHITVAVAAAQPVEDADLRRLADGFDGSTRRAEQFIRGLEVSCASLATYPDAPQWRAGTRTRSRLNESLIVFAYLGNP